MSENNKRGVHNFSGRILNWNYCKKCGLVALKNKATKRAIRKACDD